MAEGFELLVDRRALCGQSPLWISAVNSLYWVDALRRELHTYRRDSGSDEVALLPAAVTAVAADGNGQLIAAGDPGFSRLHPTRALLQTVAEVNGGDRMNEGTCDPKGRFLAGSLTHDRERPGGAVYMLDGNRARLAVGGLTACGGIGFSPRGGVMYVVDSASSVIWAYDYDIESGRAGAGRRWVACTPSEGEPAGMAVDSEGCVWVALHKTGRIHRYRPNGDLETVVWAPTTRITSLAFGGRQLDEMYVTSSCAGCDERALVADPYAGALLRFTPGAHGLPVTAWGRR